MLLMHILPSNGDCVSYLNKIMQLPRNLGGGSVNAFDRSDTVECTDARGPIQ